MKCDDSNHEGHNPRPVLELIRQIQQGTLSPKSLATEDRQRCVEHLTTEGYSIVEMSQILDVSERTISRDRIAIRRANAVNQSPDLTAEMVGHLLQQAETAISRIRRITRERDTPPAVRIDGEKACWRIISEFTTRLQSLGYLPTAATRIHGELTHHVESLPTYTEMQEEVTRFEVILNDCEADDGILMTRQLASLKEVVLQGVAHEQLTALASRIESDKEQSDERTT